MDKSLTFIMFSCLHLQNKEIWLDTALALIYIKWHLPGTCLQDETKILLSLGRQMGKDFCNLLLSVSSLEVTQRQTLTSPRERQVESSSLYIPDESPIHKEKYKHLSGQESLQIESGQNIFFPDGNLGYTPLNIETFWSPYPFYMFIQSYKLHITFGILYFFILSTIL